MNSRSEWLVEPEKDLTRAYEAISVFKSVMNKFQELPPYSSSLVLNTVRRVLSEVGDVPAVWILDFINFLLNERSLVVDSWPRPTNERISRFSVRKSDSVPITLKHFASEPPYPGLSKCDLCRRVTAKIYVDHCHMTHRVRGRICASCNRSVSAISCPAWILRAEPNAELHRKAPAKSQILRIIRVWRIYASLRRDFPQLPDPSVFDARSNEKSSGTVLNNQFLDHDRKFSSMDEVERIIEKTLAPSNRAVKIQYPKRGVGSNFVFISDEDNRAIRVSVEIREEKDHISHVSLHQKPLDGELRYFIDNPFSDKWQPVACCGPNELVRHLCSWSAGLQLPVRRDGFFAHYYDLGGDEMTETMMKTARSLRVRNENRSDDYNKALVDFVAELSELADLRGSRASYPRAVADYILGTDTRNK